MSRSVTMFRRTYERLCDVMGNRIWMYAKQRRSRTRLRNETFSLLSSNCVGGVVSHDLGLQFLSPTVNLLFRAEGFLVFLERLEKHLSAPLLPRGLSGSGYPIGSVLDTEVHFVHYASFEQAKSKWEERARRVDLENLRVCMTDRGGFHEGLLHRFAALPYRKVLLSHKPLPGHDFAAVVPGFKDADCVGEVTRYRNLFGDRHCDYCFDIVEWLNSGRVLAANRHWWQR